MQITLRNILPQYKADIETEVREWAAKLDKFYPRIVSCRVVVELPHRRHQEGNIYKAAVTLTIPQKQIVISRENGANKPHENFRIAIHDAFEDAKRQLEEYALIQDRDVKDHDNLPHGVISKIFPEGYGFIQTFGEREIYFHKNSVLDGFEKLKIGAEVRFEEEQGEKGPQATTVKLLRKVHAHHRRH